MQASSITVNLWTLILLMQALSGCFLADALSLTPDKPATKHQVPPGEVPPTTPAVGGASALAAPALARRLALDLGLSLPKAADTQTLIADTGKLSMLIDVYLATSASSAALSRMQPRIWGLDDGRISELDRMIEDGDASLEQALTPTLRRQLIDEPALMLRYVLEQRLPFPSLFTAGFTIAHTDVVDFWGLVSDGTPWVGEPYRFATYADDRPAAGLLVSPVVLAAHSADGDPLQKPRARRLLSEFACAPFDGPAAHLFYELVPDELESDLTVLATTKKSCSGCHTQFHETGPAFAGLGEASTFAAWPTYVAPLEVPTGYYAGQPYSGLAELGALVGGDPRVHRCQLERLTAAIMQRPMNERDKIILAKAMNEFNAHGFDLKAAVRKLFQTSDYSLGPMLPAVTGPTLYEASGVHILRRSHWQAIVDELAPGHALEFPPELDPGSEENVSSSWMVPTGTYWHTVDLLARQVAAAIVEAELADTSTATGRRLLTQLPDGSGFGSEPITVYGQIRAVWHRLTGEEMTSASQIYFDFQTLWTASEPDASADDFRRAWRAILVAMLTHPKVIIY